MRDSLKRKKEKEEGLWWLEEETYQEMIKLMAVGQWAMQTFPTSVHCAPLTHAFVQIPFGEGGTER